MLRICVFRILLHGQSSSSSNTTALWCNQRCNFCLRSAGNPGIFLLFQFKGVYFSDGLKPTDGFCSSPEGIFPNILDDIFTQICPSSFFPTCSPRYVHLFLVSQFEWSSFLRVTPGGLLNYKMCCTEAWTLGESAWEMKVVTRNHHLNPRKLTPGIPKNR